MIKKIFWVGIGIGIGALAVRKLGEVRNAASTDGLNRAVARVVDGLADTADAFREGMTGREVELRAALGLSDAGRDTVHAPTHRR